MKDDVRSIHADQRGYYDRLYHEHGLDPRALGHRDRLTQHERFARLARLFEHERGAFSVYEVGCGFGDFGEYLRERHPQAAYAGSEIFEPFLDVARERFPQARLELRDIAIELPAEQYDYVTLSGSFNRRSAADPQWQDYVYAVLRAMWAMCAKGIAANFLSSCAEPDRRQPDLHYQSETALLELALTDMSRHVELDLGGPLYEATLRVHRPQALRERYPAPEFARYFR